MLVFKSTQGRFKLRWKINGEVDHYYNNNCMNIVKVWQRQFWKQKKQSLPFCKKQVPKQNLYHPYQVHQACVLAIGTDCYCRYNCLRNLDISKTYENRNNHSKYFEVFFLSRKSICSCQQQWDLLLLPPVVLPKMTIFLDVKTSGKLDYKKMNRA